MRDRDRWSVCGTLLPIVFTTISLWYPSPAAGSGAAAGGIELVRRDEGAWSMLVPRGWSVTRAGEGSMFSVLLRDPRRGARQIFLFSSVGPFYINPMQKRYDQSYMAMGGYAVPWLEMPVISPPTPSRFVECFHLVADTSIARNFMPNLPRLEYARVISSTPIRSFVPGAEAAVVRAVFRRDDTAAEGMFSCAMGKVMMSPGAPGGGWMGMAWMFCGVTAPVDEFGALLQPMLKSLRSLRLSPAYVARCAAASRSAFGAAMEVGRTLRETSDMIYESWRSRGRVQDAMARKESNAILGLTRLRDPDSGRIFEVDDDFWENYKRRRDAFDMRNLEPLSAEDVDGWLAPAAPESEIH